MIGARGGLVIGCIFCCCLKVGWPLIWRGEGKGIISDSLRYDLNMYCRRPMKREFSKLFVALVMRQLPW